MSETSQPPDDGTSVREEIIRGQIDTCTEKVGEIIEPRIDVAEDDDIYQNIDWFLGQVESATIDCFSDRYQTSTLFDQLKYFLRALIEERGFEEKLLRQERGQDRIHDNPVNLCRWFSLYATVALDELVELEYVFAIEQFNLYREDDISHPTTLPTPGQGTDPTLLSAILLIWYTIEELVDVWGRILDREEDEITANVEAYTDNPDMRIGFISKLQEDRGFVTTLQDGEGGLSLRIEPQYTSYFASEGDIVTFEVPEGYNSDAGNVHNPSSDAFTIQKYS